jgi:hypothetical protein
VIGHLLVVSQAGTSNNDVFFRRIDCRRVATVILAHNLS